MSRSMVTLPIPARTPTRAAAGLLDHLVQPPTHLNAPKGASLGRQAGKSPIAPSPVSVRLNAPARGMRQTHASAASPLPTDARPTVLLT
jgi:hypothetical protein